MPSICCPEDSEGCFNVHSTGCLLDMRGLTVGHVGHGMANLFDRLISVPPVCRWSVIRICDAKTESLLHTLDMLKSLFRAMISNGYHLSDYEALVLIPCLVEKSGHNQDRIRKDHRELMKLAMQVHSKTRVLAFIMDGLESKNNRTKIECAEEIGCIIDREGIDIALGSKQTR